MDLRMKEAIRYLGYGKNVIDSKTMQLIQESFRELEEIAEPRVVYRIFGLSDIANFKSESKHLCKNLEGCSQVAVFATTLGTEVDRILRKYEIIDLPKAVIFQACAAAYLEEYCDNVECLIKEEVGEDCRFKPRFSPGYGDFSISHQGSVLQMLGAQKKIGLTLTEANMMSPSKSVTAFIGIYNTKE